jgi:hypothetical protein
MFMTCLITIRRINMSRELEEREDIFRECERHIGRIVTVFTQSGGCSGCGFTGLLVAVDCDAIKLETTSPIAPINPFECCCRGVRGVDNLGFRHHRCCNPFGTICVIPKDKIVSFCCNQI